MDLTPPSIFGSAQNARTTAVNWPTLDGGSKPTTIGKSAGIERRPLARAWTGPNGTSSRTINRGLVDQVVIWRLDHLGRTVTGLTTLFEKLRKLKVNLVSIKDSIDLSTAAGRLICNVVAQVLAALCSHRFAGLHAHVANRMLHADCHRAASPLLVQTRECPQMPLRFSLL